MAKYEQERFGIGTIHEAHDGPYEVIDKINWMTRRIRFLETGYEVDAIFPVLIEGAIKDRLKPSVAGVGYLGIPDYSKHPEYKVLKQRWNAMIRNASKRQKIVCPEDQCFATYFEKHLKKQ